jgi:endoglucanase
MWQLALVAALGLLFAVKLSDPQQHNVLATEPSQFHRGINILGYDPLWKNPEKARFQARHFAEIRNAGFDFVRVNLFVFEHMDANNRIDPEWLKRLDWVVANATTAGLSVILDEHDFGTCAKDVTTCRARLPAVWLQLAYRYRDQPASVAFELLNEPNGRLDSDTWNAMIPGLLSIVRTHNPTRMVIIGPTDWYSIKDLPELRLPANDRHITVTFHYYGPYRFTHQGAPWSKLRNLRGVTWGTAADREAIGDHFDRVGAWARDNQRPILLGEFGVYDKGGTPIGMRAQYAGTLACEAERHGFGWAYWQFDSNFIAWDMNRDTWILPIKDALIPRSPAPGRC